MKSGVLRQHLLSGHEPERRAQVHVSLSRTVARRAKCDMLEPQ